MGVLHVLGIVVGIGFLIFVHELGHFILAKIHGVRVDMFCLGFGRPLLKWKRGDTEYRLAWIPLGGFVKMAGEPLGEDRTGASDELTSKKPGQRLQIFAAGTAMNFLVAFPICILSFLVGRNLMDARVGEVPPFGSAEWEAGMTAGDRIVSVNGIPVDHLEMYKREILRAGAKQSIPVEVERGEPPQRVALTLVADGAEKLGAMPPSNVIDRVKSGSPAAQAGLQAGDVVLELDGKTLLSGQELERIVWTSPGKPLPVQVLRPATGQTLSLTVTPAAKKDDAESLALDLRTAVGEPVVRKIHPLSRAKDSLAEGDRFLTINDREIRSDRDLRDILSALPEQTVTCQILRAGENRTFHCTARRSGLGRGTLDLLLGGAEGVPALGDIPAGSKLDKAGSKMGDRILAVDGWENLTLANIEQNIQDNLGASIRFTIGRADGAPVEVDLPLETKADGKKRLAVDLLSAYPRLIEVPESWPLYAAGVRAGDRVLRVDLNGDGTLEMCRTLSDLNRAAARKKPFPVEVEREGKPLTLTVTPGPIPHGEIQVGLRYQSVFRRFGKREAVVLGTLEVFDMAKLTFQILGKIVKGEEKTSGMAGPIGIFHVSYNVIQQGVGNFLWLLGVIAVSLAIFNLLPIPILDGGHILFLLIEKIKGSPVGEKTMLRAQYAGLVLLLGLLLYVTSNDITRIFS
jgi:membrane-associated protease RseP (regulator of RpoE activity)